MKSQDGCVLSHQTCGAGPRTSNRTAAFQTLVMKYNSENYLNKVRWLLLLYTNVKYILLLFIILLGINL